MYMICTIFRLVVTAIIILIKDYETAKSNLVKNIHLKNQQILWFAT